VRALLPPQPAPFDRSTVILSATVDPEVPYGFNGDEFPTTWAKDGWQYTGAGDNQQLSPGINGSWSSPASFFRVSSSVPTETAGYPGGGFFQLQGSPFALSTTKFAMSACPQWTAGVANIKSSGVLDINGTLYWAVSCFNYGDDPDFNRQRYGPAWIAASEDGGQKWVDNPAPPVFSGRFAAPRFIQAGGPGYTQAADEFVYVLFPGTDGNAAFFELNDAIWLARVLPADILNQTAYEFYTGMSGAGDPLWQADATLAASVFEWPLHTSVQQANWHPGIQRYVFANWAWISADGNPRPDHSADEHNGRTARQRTLLTLFEAERPWGPWRLFYSDDNWTYSDGSMGAYTPVFPAAWMREDSLLMVSTQCCGTPEYPPDNHYSFNPQKVTLRLANCSS
jgi:hypothetical protein